MPENTSIQVEDGTKVIAISAFSQYSNKDKLVEITMPDSVISIGSCAFSKCANLRNVEMSKNVKYMGSEVFADCTS